MIRIQGMKIHRVRKLWSACKIYSLLKRYIVIFLIYSIQLFWFYKGLFNSQSFFYKIIFVSASWKVPSLACHIYHLICNKINFVNVLQFYLKSLKHFHATNCYETNCLINVIFCLLLATSTKLRHSRHLDSKSYLLNENDFMV